MTFTMFLQSTIALLLLCLLAGCLSAPVTNVQWRACQGLCYPEFVTEACSSYFTTSKGCLCEDDKLIWFDDDDLVK